MENLVPVDEQTAQEEFERFAEMMDLDLSTDDMSDDDMKSLERQKKTVIEAIKSGHVTVDEEGQPTVHLKCPTDKLKTVTLYEPTGSTLLARDTKKANQEVSKMFSMIQDMARLQPGALSPLKNRDMRVIQAFGALFLG